jgi:hypothetical protein
MRVKEKELVSALVRSPTRNWSATLHQARAIIKDNTICNYAGVRVVVDEAWVKAMRLCRSLPAGGRHVAQDNKLLWMWINQALTFEGESK